jgi:hypothetical protein
LTLAFEANITDSMVAFKHDAFPTVLIMFTFRDILDVKENELFGCIYQVCHHLGITVTFLFSKKEIPN